MEYINLQCTFEHPLVEPPSNLDIKPVPMKEDPPPEMKRFGKNSMHDLESLKLSQEVHPSTPKKSMSSSTNVITPSPGPKKESNPSTSKVPSSHYSHSKVASALVSSTLASNYASHASLRPKRRSHHVPACAKTCLPVKRSSNSPSLFQVLERKENSTSH